MKATVNVPFSCRSNPYLDQVREDNISWMLKHELFDSGLSIERYRTSSFAELYCYVYPRADSEDIKLLVDFETFMFLYDDQFAGNRGKTPDGPIDAMGEFMAIMYAPQGARNCSRSRLGRAFCDILARMLTGMSSSWCQQFRWSCQRFFVSYIHEAENRVRQSEPISLDLYLKQRQWALGVEPSIDAIERGGRFEIDTRMRSNPHILGLREDVNYFVALANDIDSLPKEEFTGDTNNAVFLLERSTGMQRGEATSTVARMAQEAIARFQWRHRLLLASSQYRSLPRQDRTNLDCYVAGLQDWIAGYYQWTKQTGRYTPENAEREATPWSAHQLL
ncbi:hypothetical protein [Streptomyces sp. CT34]|uniref:terpene synthase family protein n=1 Tax=Streptomyces sp. CT34 TaxID=1553907 RepID=UPI0005BB6137|nr:hypothetical protein [Streptomyces sp. CT34]